MTTEALLFECDRWQHLNIPCLIDRHMRLEDEIKRELERHTDVHAVKSALIKRGYLEEDIDAALCTLVTGGNDERARHNKVFSIKESLDRIGYGFSSQQFINILFMLSGASLFAIGFMNGLKTVLNYFISGLLKEYARLRYLGKTIISIAGIIFGFSFLGMALAVMLGNPVLFAIAMLIGTVGIIAHGDIYTDFYTATLKIERRSTFLRFVSYFGVIITALSLLLAGFIMQIIPVNGTVITLNLTSLGFGAVSMRVFGYLIAFELTAIMFIISGYVLSFISEKKETLSSVVQERTFISAYFRKSQQDIKIFTKNHKIFLLMLATVITTIVQIVGNSFYGIYIYQSFTHEFFGGFLNVAFIFMIAIIASLSGSMLTKKFAKDLGEAPMLVFGTLLIALLPVTFYFNNHLYAIALATALAVVGATIVGVAQGMLAERLLTDDEQKSYFSSLGFVSIIPTLLLVTLGALIAQVFSVELLFLILGIILAAIVMPIYFIIVLIVDKEYREKKRVSRA